MWINFVRIFTNTNKPKQERALMRANIKLMGPKPNGDFVSFESHLTFSAVNSCSLWYSPKSSSLKIIVPFPFVNIQQLKPVLTYLFELQWISTGIGATLNTKSLFHPTCLRSILANVSTTRFATFENVHSWKMLSKYQNLGNLWWLFSILSAISSLCQSLLDACRRSSQGHRNVLSGCWRQLTPYQRQDLFTTIVNHPFYRQQLYFYLELHINLNYSEQLISFKGDWM